MGALSNLDEFLLNPQVRTCSVAVQGMPRNANSENQETHGDRSSDDPYTEVGFFPHLSGQLNSPETETNSHMVTENYPHTNVFPETYKNLCFTSQPGIAVNHSIFWINTSNLVLKGGADQTGGWLTLHVLTEAIV